MKVLIGITFSRNSFYKTDMDNYAHFRLEFLLTIFVINVLYDSQRFFQINEKV